MLAAATKRMVAMVVVYFMIAIRTTSNQRSQLLIQSRTCWLTLIDLRTMIYIVVLVEVFGVVRKALEVTKGTT